jgi:hypothetical protein
LAEGMMRKLSIAVIFISLLTVAIFAQVQGSEATGSKIETTYREDKNVTQVRLQGIRLPKNKDNFSLGAAFSFEGKKNSQPPCCVTLFMNSFSTKENKYEKNHNFILWAEKEQLRSGLINYDWNLLGAWIQETMWIEIPYETFLKLVNCKKAKAQIGSFKFDLTEEQMQGLRDLSNRMKLSDAVGL